MIRSNVNISRYLLIVTTCSSVAAVIPAFAEEKPSNDWGVLLMAHGGNDAWNQAVQDTVAPLRGKFPIEIAFGMAKTSTLRDAAGRLEARGVKRVAVVRMFISGDSFLEPTEYILGLRDSLPGTRATHHAVAHGSGHDGGDDHGHNDHGHGDHGGGHHMEPPQPIESSLAFALSRQGVAESTLVNDILVDRVKALSKEPAKESVLILAHGPADEAENERWLAYMRLRVQRLHGLGAFRHVQCETLREDWPERRKESEGRIRTYVENATQNDGRCIVIPFRVAGFGPYKEILQGLEYVADERGFCPHRNMTEWIESTARNCMDNPVIAER